MGTARSVICGNIKVDRPSLPGCPIVVYSLLQVGPINIREYTTNSNSQFICGIWLRRVFVVVVVFLLFSLGVGFCCFEVCLQYIDLCPFFVDVAGVYMFSFIYSEVWESVSGLRVFRTCHGVYSVVL